MTKVRAPDTEHEAVAQALALLSPGLCASVTARSESLLRKWGDPDDDSHRIPFHQAMRLDEVLAGMRFAPAFLPLLAASVRRERDLRLLTAPDQAPLQDPARAMLDVTAEGGHVAAAVQHSLRDGEVAPVEAQAIVRACRKLRAELAGLERAALAAARRR